MTIAAKNFYVESKTSLLGVGIKGSSSDWKEALLLHILPKYKNVKYALPIAAVSQGDPLKSHAGFIHNQIKKRERLNYSRSCTKVACNHHAKIPVQIIEAFWKYLLLPG